MSRSRCGVLRVACAIDTQYATRNTYRLTCTKEHLRDGNLTGSYALPRAAPPQLYPDLERIDRLEHGHVDAERRPELADLQADEQQPAVSGLAGAELRHPDGARAASGRRPGRSGGSDQAAVR